ncbi:16S rRNA (guanine(966)-N(2))-methyltransferase RsmD [Natroniella sulfidigena]|uniref:16S rRNA (guanine(966)-N(2))-methyltransferase RsmD n=1 Tax=Natroniella sulfidigena TaxID=723921 RepID=UPI00200A842A|nr:16S rRNA (guanine(966)-N(2))-methyltransferase RsmD [Natroniella sulfidigena]MCK8818147.1 16S rRNA (guanine(966)-N(2))-methyltransferase RsmD [Natroniella sulfidigena]
MRIIAGQDKGRNLKSLDRRDVRPTSDRTREALFNILGPEIIGTRFLDLYAGFGGVGIEAMSRGADEVVYIEQDRQNIEIIKENLAMVDYQDRSQVIKGDVTKAIGRLRPNFDLIFMDPPYKKEDLYYKTVEKIRDYKLLHPTGFIIIEHDAEIDLDLSSKYDLFKRKEYGTAAITFAREEDN